MEAHEIIDKAWARGTAGKLVRLAGKTEDYWNSFRRAPRTPDTPACTGNYSPLHHYLKFFELVKAVDPEGASRMHRLLTAEVEESLAESAAGGGDLTSLGIDILERATLAMKGMNEARVRDASYSDLQRLYSYLVSVDAAVEWARANVRAELKRFSAPRDEELV